MQYQVTIINLFRPFTCDIQSQKPRYNDAFQICAKAANALSFLIDRYRIKYTLRRITLVAIVSETFSAIKATFIVVRLTGILGQSINSLLQPASKSS